MSSEPSGVQAMTLEKVLASGSPAMMGNWTMPSVLGGAVQRKARELCAPLELRAIVLAPKTCEPSAEMFAVVLLLNALANLPRAIGSPVVGSYRNDWEDVSLKMMPLHSTLQLDPPTNVMTI